MARGMDVDVQHMARRMTLRAVTPITLGDLASHVNAELHGDPAYLIDAVAALDRATAHQLAYIARARYRIHLKSTRAGAVILRHADLAACGTAALVVDDPELAYAHCAALLHPPPRPARGVAAGACIAADAYVDASASIGPCTVIEAGAVIEADVVLGPGCVIGAGCRIGQGSRLIANITVCRGAHVGQRVVIHPGAVIGSDGFGLVRDGEAWIKIPQLGSVVIGDDVEIGANTTIDRGALADTVIDDGVKLDNQIQIAHNVHIGAHSAIAGCVGIAGSARIGRRCTVGGGAGIAGHLVIADDVHLTGMSFVTGAVTEPGLYSSGMPLQTNSEWRRNMARLKHLDALARRVTALERARRDAAPTPDESLENDT